MNNMWISINPTTCDLLLDLSRNNTLRGGGGCRSSCCVTKNVCVGIMFLKGCEQGRENPLFVF